MLIDEIAKEILAKTNKTHHESLTLNCVLLHFQSSSQNLLLI